MNLSISPTYRSQKDLHPLLNQNSHSFTTPIPTLSAQASICYLMQVNGLSDVSICSGSFDCLLQMLFVSVILPSHCEFVCIIVSAFSHVSLFLSVIRSNPFVDWSVSLRPSSPLIFVCISDAAVSNQNWFISIVLYNPSDVLLCLSDLVFSTANSSYQINSIPQLWMTGIRSIARISRDKMKSRSRANRPCPSLCVSPTLVSRSMPSPILARPRTMY